MILYPSGPKEKNPAILFIHGWQTTEKSNIERAKVLISKGYICMTFDLPGHGNKPGDLSVLSRQDFLKNVIENYDELAKIPEIDNQNISVIGASFGSYLAALLSMHRQVSRLALRVPADYPNNNFDKPHSLMTGNNLNREWRKLHHTSKDSYALEAVSNFSGPILVVESEKDDAVPHQTIENYMEAVKEKNNLTYVFMTGAEHSLNDKSEQEFREILKNWF